MLSVKEMYGHEAGGQLRFAQVADPLYKQGVLSGMAFSGKTLVLVMLQAKK